MLDVVLLQIMKYRKEFQRLMRTVPVASIDPKTKALLDDFGKYFEKFDHDRIDLAVFTPRFRQWHPSLTEEQFNSYKGILRQVDQDVDENTRDGILRDLYELSLGTNIANLVTKYDAGDLVMPLSDYISAELDAFKLNVGMKEVKWDDTDILDLLQEDINQDGIKWRLNILNEHMRPMVPGDFGIVAGRPDKGKTSFMSSEVTFMAAQLADDKNVLWLNNEGPSGRIRKRLYQSALGLSIRELVEMAEDPVALKQAYIDAVGRADKIRVVNIHGAHVGQVEAIIENSNPGIIIYDMIDNIKGFGGEARTDLQLEEMYKWARERCVKYECIGIAASQISNEGDGMQFPTLGMLKDSKTGKQGACDFQLMIGASNDLNLQYSRFIGLPKNKLRREDMPGDPHAEVTFKPNIARFEDLEYGS
jgi:replicative DNA helicase